MTERLTLSYTGSFWRKMEIWLSQWDSQDGAQCFSALTLWGSEERRETWCLNQHSAISRAAAGKGPKEECVQELRPPLPTLALPPGPTGGLRRERHSWRYLLKHSAFKPRADPEGPCLAMRQSLLDFCGPVSWADSTGSACEFGFFFKGFLGAYFCFCGCVGP